MSIHRRLFSGPERGQYSSFCSLEHGIHEQEHEHEQRQSIRMYKYVNIYIKIYEICEHVHVDVQMHTSERGQKHIQLYIIMNMQMNINT